jgi:hypothetical protein
MGETTQTMQSEVNPRQPKPQKYSLDKIVLAVPLLLFGLCVLFVFSAPEEPFASGQVSGIYWFFICHLEITGTLFVAAFLTDVAGLALMLIGTLYSSQWLIGKRILTVLAQIGLLPILLYSLVIGYPYIGLYCARAQMTLLNSPQRRRERRENLIKNSANSASLR